VRDCSDLSRWPFVIVFCSCSQFVTVLRAVRHCTEKLIAENDLAADVKKSTKLHSLSAPVIERRVIG
jgi:hypothetical protein